MMVEHQPNRFIYIIFIICLSLLVNSSCSPVNQKVLRELNVNVQNKEKLSNEYEKYLKQGEEFVGSKKFQKAEESFNAALKIAEDENWINEVVSIKTKIANVYMFDKNFQKSEAMFNNAISTCENNSKCSSEQLDVTFGFLSFLYLYQIKDISKAESLVSQVKASKVFADVGTTNEKVCYFINEIKSAGYEEAISMTNKESCNK